MFILIPSILPMNGQVNAIRFHITYNPDSCRFMASLIVQNGSAITSEDRQLIQLGFSVKIPAGVFLDDIKGYAPYLGNAAYGSNEPAEWGVNFAVNSPEADPANDYYMLSPYFDDELHFNDLSAGDTVLLFSFVLSPVTQCAQGLKFYDSDQDPGPDDPGMGFVDFSQIMILGNSGNLWSGNTSEISATKPVILPEPVVSCSMGVEIDISVAASGCQLPLSYLWTGPANYTSTTQDVALLNTTTANTGLYKVVVTDALGCQDSLTIYAQNKPYAGTDQLLCGGASTIIQGIHPADGVWSALASNAPGATVSPAENGVSTVDLDNNAAGNYGFMYSSGVCADTLWITVNSGTPAAITGDNELCIGGVSTVVPSSGGYWVSSNPAVASVSNSGNVLALSAGKVVFTYTGFASGCQSSTDTLVVHPKPQIANTGTPAVCIGSNTLLSPSSGGAWQGLHPSIAGITVDGMVTGISIGLAAFYFTDQSTGCSSDTMIIPVEAVPVASVFGVQSICVNGVTQVLPQSGGFWTSSEPGVATASGSGLVTGLAQGNARFYFTSASTGCISNWTEWITVLPPPVVQMPVTSICIGESLLLNPNTGGTWQSSSPAIASVGQNNGLVTGLQAGKVVFSFTNSTTGCTSVTDTLEVRQNPVISIGSENICIGSLTGLSPASGGTWISLDNDIATVVGANVVGLSAGFVSLLFTDAVTGCQNSVFLSVTPRAVASLTDDTAICVGSTTELSPASGGTWTSTNPAVANVDNNGIVTGINAGTVQFIFTETATGCNSLPTAPLTIYPNPVLSIAGDSIICIGNQTQLLPSSGGFWYSNEPGIAVIDEFSGLATALQGGFVNFTFISFSTGCSSISKNVFVVPQPEIAITGPANVCLGGSTQLVPSAGGVWQASDESVAIVNNNGQVFAIGTGKVVFTYTETAFGCGYSGSTDSLHVIACFNPDVLITFTHTITYGDISTNDADSQENYYKPDPVLSTSPPGSNPVITLDTNGTLQFITDLPGTYIYEPEICKNGPASDCPKVKLTIFVHADFRPESTVVAMPDIVTTMHNTAVNIPVLANDRCVLMGGCSLSPASVQITESPVFGSYTINASDGIISYVPQSGFSGTDKMIYKVCATASASICASAEIIITVVSDTGNEKIAASDDFVSIQKFQTANGNVLQNDYASHGQILSVSPQSIQNDTGTFNLEVNGNFEFTPNASFTGSVSYVYDVCSVNMPGLCTRATLHLLIHDEYKASIRVYLEGALMNNGNATANGRPLMRDNLRQSPFTGLNYIPSSDPYTYPADMVFISHLYNKVGPGTLPQLQIIPSPVQVFSVSGPDAIVDWVFVQLRSKNNPSQVIATRSGLLQRDGDVVDLDGLSPLRFPGVIPDDYYVAVRHRNHLGVMTRFVQSPEQTANLIDFTSPATLTFDFGTSKNNGFDYTGLAQNSGVKSGYMAMWAGDFDGNKKIKAENPNDDTNVLFFEMLVFPTNLNSNANFDFAIGYFQGDFDMNSKSKFDNPNDDKNMIIAQVLFYPLNINFLANFDFILEQLP